MMNIGSRRESTVGRRGVGVLVTARGIRLSVARGISLTAKYSEELGVLVEVEKSGSFSIWRLFIYNSLSCQCLIYVFISHTLIL